MDKRIAKRHKRQTDRAKLKVKTSEPDVRTQEQVEADRAASRPEGNLRTSGPTAGGSSRSLRSAAATSTGSSAKTGA